MCLALPVKVIKIRNKNILVETRSQRMKVDGSLVKIRVGDSVILQNNFIVGKITKKEAKEIINLIKK